MLVSEISLMKFQQVTQSLLLLLLQKTLILFYISLRLQEKHVKEKQVEHQRHIIDLQEKLKKNQIQVSCTRVLLLTT